MKALEALFEKILEGLPPLDEKNRNFVLAGMVAVIFLVFYFAAIGPQLATLSKVTPEINLLDQDIKKAQEDTQKINYYQSEIIRLEKLITEINQRIRSREEVPLILEGISRLAHEQHVHINQMMPQVDAQESLLSNSEGKFFGLPVLIEASSGYHNLGKFLNAMENEGLGLTIQRLSLNSNSEDSTRHSIKMTLRTIIFEKAQGEKSP